MDSPKRALLLVASPKASNSTSESLGTYLLEKLANSGFVTQTAHVQTLMRSDAGQQAMLELVKASDLIILSFPLYVDSLPAAAIKALEHIAQGQREMNTSKKHRLVAIVNNGFPEASQNSTAIAICKQFASEANFEWAGGLGLGGGGAIGGKPLKQVGSIARNARKALDLAAADLLEDKPVSKEAANLMAKQLVPKWLYLAIGNRSWKQQAKAFGSQNKLYDQP
jgi:multimeric flavodoxin WrbA